jgi:hypothetical protein
MFRLLQLFNTIVRKGTITQVSNRRADFYISYRTAWGHRHAVILDKDQTSQHALVAAASPGTPIKVRLDRATGQVRRVAIGKQKVFPR